MFLSGGVGGGGIGISSACLVYRILVGECWEYRRTCLGNLRYFENSNNTKCTEIFYEQENLNFHAFIVLSNCNLSTKKNFQLETDSNCHFKSNSWLNKVHPGIWTNQG